MIEVDKENTPEQMKYIKPIVLARAVMTVSYVENADNKDAEAIAKTALVPAHHPCIGIVKLDKWLIFEYIHVVNYSITCTNESKEKCK